MSVASKIADHLEFLGYKIEEIKGEEGRKIYIASHSKLNNIIFVSTENLSYLQTILNTERRLSPQMYEYCNAANSIMNVSRVYATQEEGKAQIKFDCVYSGDYDKTAFGELLEAFTSDQQNFNRLPKFDKIWL